MSQLDDQAFIHIAKYFQALAEPMRLKILNGLRDGEKTSLSLLGFLVGHKPTYQNTLIY